jgi:hypothetical protein
MVKFHSRQIIRLILLFVVVVCGSFGRSLVRAQSAAPGRGAAVLNGESRGGNGPRFLPLSEIDGVIELGAGIYRITDPRPLARVADLLQRKFGVPISYEEEVLQYSGDMVPASELPGNRELATRFPAWKGPLVPRLGTVELSIPPSVILKQIADPTEFIHQAIDSHQMNRNVGGFKLVKVGSDGFSIVMDKVADNSGKISAVIPALDIPVSFPEKERSLGETIGLISQAVKAAGKQPFGVGGPGSESFFERTMVKIGAQNETARNVLARALRIPGSPVLSWDLSTLPGGISILAVRTVSVEAIDSTGRPVLQPVIAAR